MKLSKIIKLTKKDKVINIVNQNGIQLIGNQNYMYCVNNDIPRLDKNSIIALWEIPGKDLEKYEISVDTAPKDIYSDICSNESIIGPIGIRITYLQNEYMAFKTSRGVLFVNYAYMEPLRGPEEIRFFERIDSDNSLKIVVKSGFILLAVLTPVNLIMEEMFVSYLNLLKGEKQLNGQ